MNKLHIIATFLAVLELVRLKLIKHISLKILLIYKLLGQSKKIMEMIKMKVKGVIEALLFVSDKPLSAEKMLEILKDDVNKKDIIGLIENLMRNIQKRIVAFVFRKLDKDILFLRFLNMQIDKKLYKSKIIPRLSKTA